MAKPTMSSASLDYNESGTVIGDETEGAVKILANDCGLLNDWAEEMLQGDGTAGRVVRRIWVLIDDATDASKIKPSTGNGWNGDTIAAEDNLAKGGSTTNFSLDANGNDLTVEASGLTGNCVGVLAAEVIKNQSTTDCTVNGKAVSNDIVLEFYDTATGANVDLTSAVDTGNIQCRVTYITSS